MKCISNFSIFNTLNLKWLPCYAQSKQIPEWTICQIKIKMPFIRIGKGYFMPGMIVSKASDALQIWADILTTFCTNSEVKLSNSISPLYKRVKMAVLNICKIFEKLLRLQLFRSILKLSLCLRIKQVCAEIIF